MKYLICKIFGHKWVLRPLIYTPHCVRKFECKRCGIDKDSIKRYDYDGINKKST